MSFLPRNNWLKILLGIFIVLIGFVITTCSVTKKNIQRKYEQAVDSKPFDAIIVPGVPFEGDTWQMIMKMRVYWSLHLYEKGIAKNIIYSGSSVYSPYIEAEVMKRYAEELGIPAENIITEPRAEHSTENVYYSYHLAKQHDFKRIALATDPFQTKMVIKFVRKHFKNKLEIIPIDYERIESLMEQPDPKIDTTGLHVDNFVSITERESWWKQFQGTLGNNIDFSEFED